MAVNGIQWNDLVKAEQVPSDGYFYRVGSAVAQAQLRRAQNSPQKSAAALCPPSWLLLCQAPAKEAGSWSLPALFLTAKQKVSGKS